MNGMTSSTTQRTLAGSSNLRSTSAVKSLALETAYGGVYIDLESTFDKASQSSLGCSMEIMEMSNDNWTAEEKSYQISKKRYIVASFDLLLFRTYEYCSIIFVW
jgi:hypothetical protein